MDYRRRADPIFLQHLRHRDTVAWVPSVVDVAKAETNELLVQSNPEAGFEQFAKDFAVVATDPIRTRLSSYDISIQPTTDRLDPTVSNRFLETYAHEATRGVHPRILYHGTKDACLESIYQKGIVTQKTLGNEDWYTDAIWTATDPQTSVWYTGNKGGRIFACAVLDENVVCADDPPPAMGNSKSAPKGRTKKSAERFGKSETRFRRNQHRQTRKAPSKLKHAHPGHTTHLGKWAVLVRDETRICPVMEMELSQKLTSKQKAQTVQPQPKRLPQNTNKDAADHAIQTRAAAYEDATRQPYKHHTRMVWNHREREADMTRKHQRAMKSCSA